MKVYLCGQGKEPEKHMLEKNRRAGEIQLKGSFRFKRRQLLRHAQARRRRGGEAIVKVPSALLRWLYCMQSVGNIPGDLTLMGLDLIA